MERFARDWMERMDFVNPWSVRKRIVRIKNDVEIKASKDSVIIKGNDIEGVGQTAADIENVCKITLRDRRIFNDGVYIDVKGVQE